MVIGDPLAERVRATPDTVAMIDAETDREWTFRQLDGSASALAARILDVTPGDRICLLRRTSTDAIRALHAGFRLGTMVVPLNPDLATGRLREQIATADPSVVVGPEGHPVLDRLTVPTIRIDDDPERPDPNTHGRAPKWGWTDPMVLLFTSGSTGDPKPVPLTVQNLLASAIGSAFRLGVVPTDNWVCCLPINHMGGLAPFLRSTLYGTATTVHEGFDAETVAQSLTRHEPTGISVVPTQLRRLIDVDAPLDRLRFVLLGGGPIPEELIDRCQRADIAVYPTYGLTEAASQVTTATPREATAHPGTVGRPLMGTTVTIVDDDGTPLPAGSVGEIVVSGPTVMPGYWRDQEATARVFDDLGFHTGDRGYLDGGRLWVVGRSTDEIVTGGETVNPTEVRAVIRSHPAVDDAAVVGLPDPEWGERVGALVVAEGITEADLAAFTRERLAGFETPKSWLIVDDLPRTDSGTIDRPAVLDRLRDVHNANGG